MSQHVLILEYSQGHVKDGVIHGVKIIGTKSRNGRSYPAAVLAAAMPLYEGVAVYMLHPDHREKQTGTRHTDAQFGSLSHIEQRPDGLYGDLTYRQAHPCAGLVLENLDKPFGLSHNAVCELNEDKTEVLRIERVNSVDLVDDPATTRTLFEEKEMTLDEMNTALDARLGKLEEKLEAKQEKLVALLEAKPEKPPEKTADKPKPKPKLQMLENVIEGDDGTPAPIGNTHDDFMGALRGFAVTN